MAVNMTPQTPETPPSTATTPAQMRANPLMTLRDEMDRLFDNFFGRRMVDLDPFRRMGAAFASMGDIAPEVDVCETEGRIEITAELPGMDDKDVQVAVREGVLTISGRKTAERREEKADYHLNERSFGSFTRSFRLPDAADTDAITAEFDKGVLKVAVPKKDATPPAGEKKIEIKRN